MYLLPETLFTAPYSATYTCGLSTYAESAGMVLDNDMAPVWWKFIRDTLKARGK